MILKKPWKSKRVKTPTLLQMEALECGAAALGIVLGYYGRFVPLEKLRAQCGVSRDGSKAGNVIKAAREYGLQAKGYRLEPEKLTTLPLPSILFWEFNHFVVLEGIKGKNVFLNDPASGPKKVTRDKLDTAFTGVALAFAPGPEFTTGGKRSNVFAHLFKEATAGGQGLWLLFLLGLALVIPGLAVPLFGQFFVDEILVKGHAGWFKPLLLGMALTAILRALLTWTWGQVLVRQRIKMATSMSARFVHHMLRLPYNFFNQRYGGEVGNRTHLNDDIANLLASDLASTGVGLLSVIFFAALMITYDPVLTVIGISFALANILLLRWVNRRRSDLNRRMLQESANLEGAAMGGLQLIETIKATASETVFFSRFAGRLTKVKRTQQEMAVWSLPVGPVPGLLQTLSTVLVLGIGATRVMDGAMTMGMLVAFQSLMSSFLSPFSQLVGLGSTLQTIKGDVERVRDVLSYEPDPLFGQAATHEAKHIPATGDLELRNVSFGYSPLDPPLFENLNLRITPGARVALVGSSGSGKSSIARLACGLLHPWEGEVLCDQTPLMELGGRALVGAMTLVDQDIFLFEGTVRENLAMWRTDMDDARLARAARDAMIHDHVASLPGGYDAHVRENGANFSGGQRQRLEIARALVMNPAILVLDEATSALDPHTEKQVMDNIRTRGVSCLIVAHRLSTIRDCDEIIVLERGNVVERGTHEQLMQASGTYKHLIET